MSLKNLLQNDWKTAYKAKDKVRATTLSMARAAILQLEKSGTCETADDASVLEIITREVKQRRESVEEFARGNRQDLIEATQKEIQILLEYLPKQLTQQEIVEIISDTAIEVGASSAKDMGKLMSAIVLKTKGKADGKLVSKLVKEYLS
ncbi:MAG: GatB/YqeY domain-containing protein [Clostridium sp.]